ncbi:MAG: hypothetical protein AB3N23_02890 [Paracoccaceae bacterium]
MKEVPLPRLKREAEIAVYLIHNSPDAEDYFFLFDFEEFVERSQGGVFVRPVLKVFAGRDDFSRTLFARQFREVFAVEFDRMREELAQSKRASGWISWKFGVGSVVDLVGGMVANLVLAVALSLGKSLLSLVSLPSFLKGRSDDAKLADEIEQMKGRVERALAGLTISLHPELYAHAYRNGPLGKMAGMDREAWPLPSFVRTHLDDGRSGSWW